ncbi:MAG: phenylalanine--tRNA ligase subunit alpha [Deltaproteobacteria bacterium]|nr:MAG: phenylalanine--tRNA ligase subunit alpha [Deltaproteobacteria bacterium]
MIDSLNALRDAALAAVDGVSSLAELGEVQVKFLGRKGELTQIMRGMGKVAPEDRPKVGQVVNEVRSAIEARIEAREAEMSKDAQRLKFAAEAVDVTRAGRAPKKGTLHPLTQVVREISDIFANLGFEVAEGREVEQEYYNFEALNIPEEHPARDMQDTFYVAPGTVLRTHTSPVQVRVMEAIQPPVRIIAPGKVYRCDSDVTHSPMFHQVEGLLIDEGITFADLKGVLEAFIHEYYGPDMGVRFRPSFFPFTEPSAEVDISCVFCKGSGCRICSHTGWLEILGSGSVDPAVFGFVGYDPEKVQGFAFGIGVERIAMLKYGIDDIRLFFDNDVRFLSHFR